MMYLPFISAFASFFFVLVFTPWFLRYMKTLGLVVKDMNKKDTPLIPLSGGIIVLAGVIVGVFIFIFFKIFFFKARFGLFLDYKNMSLLLASLISLFILTFIGFLDDIVILGKKETSSGLNQWQKPILTLFAAVPLMAVSTGTTLDIPFLGIVDFGLIYPLFFIPFGVVGASNMVNLFAGFNGLEAGMGVIYLGMLGLYAYFHNSYVAALIALVTLFSLFAFLYYNSYPAKLFPGDSLTYLLGGVLAVIALVGHMEKVTMIASFPFFIEFFLKLRRKFNAKSYGYYFKGKVKSHYDKIYSLPHFFTRSGKFTEKQVVFFCLLISLFFSSLIWFV